MKETRKKLTQIQEVAYEINRIMNQVLGVPKRELEKKEEIGLIGEEARIVRERFRNLGYIE